MSDARACKGLQTAARGCRYRPGLCRTDQYRGARPERSKRSSQVAPLADAVERSHELIEEVLAGVSARRAAVRFGASKALRILSERVPELLYPHFDFFVAMLDQDNHILQWNATITLANLARVDRRVQDRSHPRPLPGPHFRGKHDLRGKCNTRGRHHWCGQATPGETHRAAHHACGARELCHAGVPERGDWACLGGAECTGRSVARSARGATVCGAPTGQSTGGHQREGPQVSEGAAAPASR